MQIIQEQPVTQAQPVVQAQPNVVEQNPYPKYFSVKQNKNYVMGEFADRYELYLKTDKGLKLVRTDYKNQRI